jgi:hypothetical protein
MHLELDRQACMMSGAMRELDHPFCFTSMNSWNQCDTIYITIGVSIEYKTEASGENTIILSTDKALQSRCVASF